MKDFGSQQFPPLPDKLRCPQTSAFEDDNHPQVLRHFLQATRGYNKGGVKSHEVQFGDETAGQKTTSKTLHLPQTRCLESTQPTGRYFLRIEIQAVHI